MELELKDRLFIVTGASSGLGNAVVSALAGEKAQVIAVARREEMLNKLAAEFPGNIEVVCGDILNDVTHQTLLGILGYRFLDGIFINAGGPPAKTIAETTMNDWDEAYTLLVRWKVILIKALLERFSEQRYGRVVFSESSTLKQPVENLVLSNAFRMAIAGFSKTLSEEYADKGITFNILAPGHHDTEAINRIFRKKSEIENITFEEAKTQSIQKIKVKKMGDPDDFASLALWLLSPKSKFVTGQIYCLDGGNVKGVV